MDTKIGVVGLGYVGLPLALTAVENGWTVIGFDINSNLIENLKSGKSHINDVSDIRLSKSFLQEKFIVVEEPKLLSDVDICIICVPTPVTTDHKPDLTYVISASRLVSTVLKPNCVVVNESTSYPGTLRNVIQNEILSSRKKLGDLAGYVAAPERVDPKNLNYDHSNTPRVLGGDNLEQVSRVADFYRSLGPEITVVSSPEAAEFSKLIENAFRLVNISFINELVPYASALGVDLMEVVNAAATKPFGFMKFIPGPGVGGHCIPVDPHYLVNSANKFEVELPLLKSAIEVNLGIPERIIKKVKEILVDQIEVTVLLMGIAYKNGISDTRESPANPIAEGLMRAGYKVCWIDDEVSSWEKAPEFTGEKINFAIALASSTPDQIEKFSKIVQVLDCTGKYVKHMNVISYFNS